MHLPFIAYQAATRFVCSARLHHICVIATKAGAGEQDKISKLALVFQTSFLEQSYTHQPKPPWRPEKNGLP